MQRVWFLVYNTIVVPGFWVLLQIGALLNGKIRRGLRGRKDLFEHLEQEVKLLKKNRRFWFHSSSMGEFEQAKPIIAELRKRYDDIDIIVSFFSPSGYEHSRNYKLADLITYLPFDSAGNARRFLDLVRPSIAIMVRYDIWPNHVWELRKRGVPIVIANATLRKNSSRHYPILKSFHQDVYNQITSILTVSQSDVDAFQNFGLKHPEVHAIGETRYDQVWQRSLDAKTKHLIPAPILRRKKVFVVGSSWDEDEEILLPAFRRIAQHDSNALMILVPHEPTLPTLERLELSLNYTLRAIRFSDLNDYSNENVILVDSIGILMSLYQYADVAYVGGSFRQGIHNVLEPAVYGVPVLYGPKHQNSQEAVELARRGGSFVVTTAEECYLELRRLFNDKKARVRAGGESQKLVQENVGATQRFIEYIETALKH
ncbi:MAG: 3-deoxy-D-manno-octulosonic acid transferase [Ignavibacteriales bacterium]|nr:3-deoxy-D-manno-octulosonic acid transferase [Ignavibacteriales bacterium]